MLKKLKQWKSWIKKVGHSHLHLKRKKEGVQNLKIKKINEW